VIGHVVASFWLRAQKSPPAGLGAGSSRRLEFFVAKLNGFALRSRPWSQDTVFGVPAATLLRGFRSHVAEIDGRRTRYWVGGDGPPVVLVHGLGGAAVNFADLAPLLARRHRVLVLDLPGHGGTEPLRELDGLGDLANHVAATAEREEMLPAAVVGYSMGGVVALRLAVSRPADVVALALVAPAGIVSQTRRAQIWLTVAAALRPAGLVALVRGAIARRPNLRIPVFGYWGAQDPRALTPSSVLGFLQAQREHTDVRGAATISSRSRTASNMPDASGARFASCRLRAILSSASTPPRRPRSSKRFSRALRPRPPRCRTGVRVVVVAAALSGEGDEPAERWLGSLDLVTRDGEWVSSVVYAHSVEAWRAEYADPFAKLACGNARAWNSLG
jgi:pimeloyl-ACP methyl ester carboxylesterase